MQRRHNCCNQEQHPLKSTKHDRRFTCLAHSVAIPASGNEDRESDEAGKPENHGDEFDGKDGELVRKFLEAEGCDDKVHEDEECPDGGEEEEVGGTWGPRAPG